MLRKRKQEFAAAACSLALALALWGCVGSTNSSLSTKVTAPAFAIQPASLTVTVGQAANFSVMVTGTGPFTYQCRKTAPTSVARHL